MDGALMRSSKRRVVSALGLLMTFTLACSIAEELLLWGEEALDEYAAGPVYDEGEAIGGGDDWLPEYEEQGAWDGEQQDDDRGGQQDYRGERVYEDALAIYVVRGDQILEPQFPPVDSDLRAYQDDTDRHQAMWDLFAGLVPPDNRTYLSGYVIFSDGPGEALAAVDPDPQDPALWILSVDIIDAENTLELVASLIHEFGHLLTLNATQVPPDIDVFQAGEEDWEAYEQAEAACPTYFTGEGCSRPDAYINVFFGRFWSEIYAEWYDIDTEPDEDEYYARLDAFYLKYQDRFISDYAATNPGEDIAETWMVFVLEERPSGDSIAEQKILFFYAYPDLVALRAQIRENMP